MWVCDAKVSIGHVAESFRMALKRFESELIDPRGAGVVIFFLNRSKVKPLKSIYLKMKCNSNETALTSADWIPSLLYRPCELPRLTDKRNSGSLEICGLSTAN